MPPVLQGERLHQCMCALLCVCVCTRQCRIILRPLHACLCSSEAEVMTESVLPQSEMCACMCVCEEQGVIAKGWKRKSVCLYLSEQTALPVVRSDYRE